MGIVLFVKKERLLTEIDVFLFVELISSGMEIHVSAIQSLFELNQHVFYVVLILFQIKLKSNVFATVVLYGALFH